MNDQISIRLDAFRAIAALSVFFSHFAQLGRVGDTHDALWALGRFGVVGFFVMSGYVIAYVAEYKHPTLTDYLEARFARLYSVFLPALMVTVVLDFAGSTLNPSGYSSYPAAASSKPFLYLPFFVTFMFENSWFSLRWLSNGPMWSIAYEFWYYMVFGVLTYVPQSKKVPLLLCVLCIAGWKILLLAPIWIAGVLVYRSQNSLRRLASGLPQAILCLSLCALAFLLTQSAFVLMGPVRDMGAVMTLHGFHSFFLNDYIFTVPVIGLMTAIVCIPGRELPLPCRKVIASLAGCSFSVYLFHVPLILFVRSTEMYDPASLTQSVIAATLVLSMCYLLSLVTEQRKRFWRALFHGIFSRFGKPDGRAINHV